MKKQTLAAAALALLYPDNKLTGAEFEVYRDSNGDKKLDDGDELLGLMEETSTGIY